jgi:iron complex transport system ATP-binding protein
MRHRIDVFETVARLNRDQRRTIIIVSHDLNLASLYCDRLVLIKAGKIIADGQPSEVIREEALEESYGVRMEITEGSAQGRPFVIPLRRQD